MGPERRTENSIHSAHLTTKNSPVKGVKKPVKNRGMSGVPGVSNLGVMSGGLTQMNVVPAISSLSGPSQRRIDNNQL